MLRRDACSAFIVLVSHSRSACRQPRRLLGPIGQHPQREDAEDHGRQALDGEQPLPSVQAEASVEREQRLRHRCADDDRDRRGHHEQRARAGAIGRRDPVGEIQDESGEESCLRQPEQNPDRIERSRAGDEHHGDRDEAPADHDARNPAARADALQDQVARNFEEAVSEEEQSRAEAVRGVAQVQIPLQRLGGEPDVHAVDIGDDVTEERERNDAGGSPARDHALAILIGSPGTRCRDHRDQAARISR